MTGYAVILYVFLQGGNGLVYHPQEFADMQSCEYAKAQIVEVLTTDPNQAEENQQWMPVEDDIWVRVEAVCVPYMVDSYSAE